jgi:NADH dehydrogenase (ubiquinone) flavoprotein 2
MLRGSTEILNTACETLGGIKPGQTTKDGKFTVIEVECQGACSNAPMMAIGDDFYVRDLAGWNVYLFLIALLPQEDLTVETTKKILDAFSKGQRPKIGPQSGRQTSENSAGLTALTSKVRFCCP